MKAPFRIISILLITCIYSNVQGFKNLTHTQDSITILSELLTGKWQLIGQFEKGEFIETELTSSSSIEGSTTEVKVMTDSGIIKKVFQNDSLISINKIKEIDLIEMSFNKTGKGFYQHFSDYNPDSDIQIISTCQPIPEIKIINGKYILHFTSMTGESENSFLIKGDILTIKLDNDREERYMRYKK